MMDARRFPLRSPRMVAAFRALGVAVMSEVVMYERTGERRERWWVEGQNADGVRRLVQLLTDRKRPLAVLRPEHPLLAALYGLEARAALRAWHDGGEAPVWVRTRGRLMRLVKPGKAAGEPDGWAEYWQGRKPAVKLATLEHGAAAAVCGFALWPQLLPGGIPAAAGESVTFPGLNWELIQRVCVPLRTEGMCGFPLGGHPWDFAMAAMGQEDRMPQVAEAAGRNPRIFFKGRSRPGAVATLNLLESRDSRFRDRMLYHLR